MVFFSSNFKVCNKLTKIYFSILFLYLLFLTPFFCIFPHILEQKIFENIHPWFIFSTDWPYLPERIIVFTEGNVTLFILRMDKLKLRLGLHVLCSLQFHPWTDKTHLCMYTLFKFILSLEKLFTLPFETLPSFNIIMQWKK